MRQNKDVLGSAAVFCGGCGQAVCDATVGDGGGGTGRRGGSGSGRCIARGLSMCDEHA